MDQTTDPLQLPLRDIHLPADISWWPPAPGWWLIVGLILSVTLFWKWWYRRKLRLKFSAINLAKEEFKQAREQYSTHQDHRQIVREISILLRRLSISTFPRVETASLTGTAWLQFLDGPMPATPFTSGAGRMLIDAPYRQEVKSEEIEPLFRLCDEWISAVAENQGASR